jgi:hypothetical protein
MANPDHLVPPAAGNGSDTCGRERIAEIGEILARGLVRLKLRQSSGRLPPAGESSLGFVGDQSGDAERLGEKGVAS